MRKGGGTVRRGQPPLNARKSGKAADRRRDQERSSSRDDQAPGPICGCATLQPSVRRAHHFRGRLGHSSLRLLAHARRQLRAKRLPVLRAVLRNTGVELGRRHTRVERHRHGAAQSDLLSTGRGRRARAARTHLRAAASVASCRRCCCASGLSRRSTRRQSAGRPGEAARGSGAADVAHAPCLSAPRGSWHPTALPPRLP
jgi:hypothetical protein